MGRTHARSRPPRLPIGCASSPRERTAIPNIRATAVFLAGVLTGLAAGVVTVRLIGSRGREPSPTYQVVVPVRGGDGTSESLALLAAADPHESGEASLRGTDSRAGDDASRRGHRAAMLATLGAMRGDEAAFLRLATEALSRGVSLDELISAVKEFPADRRGAILAALLDHAPASARASVEFVRLLAESGQPDRALALVRAELPLHPGFQPEFSRLLLRLDPEGGAKLLFGLEGSEHWDADDMAVLRAALAETGNEGKLVPFLGRALEERPADHGMLRLLRAVSPVEARARTEALLKGSPNDPWALRFLGEIERDAGDAAGAFQAFRDSALASPSRSTFRDLVKLDPVRGLELALAWTKDAVDDEMIGAQAEMYLLAGRKDDAVRSFLRAHEHDPNDGEWIANLTELDPAVAIAALERRIGFAPEAASSRLLGRYARALDAAGRKDDAYSEFLAALAKDPDNDEWQRSIARIDPRAAIPVLQAHVRDHPVDASGHGALGLALAAVGRRDDALSELDLALARGEADRWYSALRDLDPDRALEGLRRRAAASGEDAAVWVLLGGELKKRNLRSEARSAYERAADIDPSDGDVARALRDLR